MKANDQDITIHDENNTSNVTPKSFIDIEKCTVAKLPQAQELVSKNTKWEPKAHLSRECGSQSQGKMVRIPRQMGGNPNAKPCNSNFPRGKLNSSREAHAILEEWTRWGEGTSVCESGVVGDHSPLISCGTPSQSPPIGESSPSNFSYPIKKCDFPCGTRGSLQENLISFFCHMFLLDSWSMVESISLSNFTLTPWWFSTSFPHHLACADIYFL